MARVNSMKLFIPMAKIPIEYKTMEIKLYKGSFKDFGKIDKDECKTWKHFLTVSRPCSYYESGLVNIYKTAKKGVYAIKTYYDGCFHPLVAYSHLSAEVIKAIEDVWTFVNAENKRG